MSAIDNIIDNVLAAEGEAFTNDPADSGGPTKWGVTQATLGSYLNRPATVADVQGLTRDVAAAVYRNRYVQAPGFGAVLELSEAVGAELVDTGVNCGPAVAAMFLQRCLNALNLNGTKYADIGVDGDCGPGTLSALRAFLAWRGHDGERVLLVALNCLQGERYIDLAERRPKDEAFVYGWLKQRVAA